MNITIDQKAKLQNLVNNLETLIKEIEKTDYIYQQEEFLAKMSDLWGFIQSYDDEEIIDFFIHTDEFEQIRKKGQLLEEYYERAIEINDALIMTSDIMNKEDNVLQFSSSSFVADNYNMVQKEFEMFENKTPQQLVMVGCGPLPETILFLADNTDIPQIIGIDANQEAIAIAGKVVKSLGLKDRVKLVYSYGQEYDYKDADLIHIANATHNKNEILEQVAKTSKKGVEILIRNPSRLANIMYENTLNIPLNLIKQKNKEGNSEFLHTPSLYQKLDY